MMLNIPGYDHIALVLDLPENVYHDTAYSPLAEEIRNKVAEVSNANSLINNSLKPGFDFHHVLFVALSRISSVSINVKYILDRLMFPLYHIPSHSLTRVPIVMDLCVVFQGTKSLDKSILETTLPLDKSNEGKSFGLPYDIQKLIDYTINEMSCRIVYLDKRFPEMGTKGNTAKLVQGLIYFGSGPMSYDSWRGVPYMNITRALIDLDEEPFNYVDLLRMAACSTTVAIYLRPMVVDDEIEIRGYVIPCIRETSLAPREHPDRVIVPNENDFDKFTKGKLINVNPKTLINSLYYSLLISDALMTAVRLRDKVDAKMDEYQLVKFRKRYPAKPKQFLDKIGGGG